MHRQKTAPRAAEEKNSAAASASVEAGAALGWRRGRSTLLLVLLVLLGRRRRRRRHSTSTTTTTTATPAGVLLGAAEFGDERHEVPAVLLQSHRSGLSPRAFRALASAHVSSSRRPQSSRPSSAERCRACPGPVGLSRSRSPPWSSRYQGLRLAAVHRRVQTSPAVGVDEARRRRAAAGALKWWVARHRRDVSGA